MEKRYLIGYAFGKEMVMFDDIQNFSETFDEEDGVETITFKEGKDGETYTYVGNEHTGYKEVNRKAPSFEKWKTFGRRTAKRHNYFDNRVEADPNRSNNNFRRPYVNRSTASYGADDDFISREGVRVRLANDSGYSSCGGETEYREVRGCGGSSVYRRGSCGGWIHVSGDGPCGSVYTTPYYSGCGGSGGCGGGHC